MSIIVFANSKGGVGKTTSACVLIGELIERGRSVAAIDADPERHLTKWAAKPGSPTSLTVVTDVTDSSIIDAIDAVNAAHEFTVIDLEGIASLLTANAISVANLTIVPLQCSSMDENGAAKMLGMIRNAERLLGRKIAYRLLFTRTNVAVQPRLAKEMRSRLLERGVQVMDAELSERAAFKELLADGGTLGQRALSGNIDAARRNARQFADEILNVLMDAKPRMEAAE